MKIRKTKTAGKYRAGIIRLFIAAVLIGLLDAVFLFFFSAVQAIQVIETTSESELAHVSYSYRHAETDRRELESNYDERYLRKLRFLDHIAGAENRRDYASLKARFFPEESFFLLTADGSPQETGEEEPFSEEVRSLLAEKEGKEGILTDEQYRYYYLDLDPETIGVIRRTDEDYKTFLNHAKSGIQILYESSADRDGYLIAAQDGVIFLDPDYKHMGQKSEDVIAKLLDLEQILHRLRRKTASVHALQDYSLIMLTSGEKKHLAVMGSCFIPDEGVELYHVTELPKIISLSAKNALAVLIVLLTVLFVYVMFYWFLKTDQLRSPESEGAFEHNVKYRLFAVAAIGIFLCGCMAYYANTLFRISSYIMDDDEDILKIRSVLKNGARSAEELTAIYETEYLDYAHMISFWLSDAPSFRTAEELRSLSGIFGLDYIMTFNQEGKEVLSDSGYVGFAISENPEDQSYPFRILERGVSEYAQEARKDELTDTYHQIIGVRLETPDGRPDGFLQIIFSPQHLDYIEKSSSLSSIFDHFVVSAINRYFVINAETGVFEYSPEHVLDGQPAGDHGFSEAALSPRWKGYAKIDGSRYYLSSFLNDGYYIYNALETGNLYPGRTMYVFFAVILSLLSILILRGILETIEHPHARPDPSEDTDPKNAKDLNRTEKMKPVGAEKAEDRLGKLLYVIGMSAAIVLFVSFLFGRSFYGDSSIIVYILENQWPRGINVFSVSAVIIFSLSAFAVVSVFDRILKILSRILSPRMDTLLRLLCSTVQYGSVILVLFISLACFGMDVQSLLAGAGILAIVVGLGAKALIMDIIAGLFIIFEGDFQVGDIVEIGGYTGTVRDIGIRTIRIESWDGNIKVINNRSISSVINRTMSSSFARVEFPVPVSVNPDDLTAIFREELPVLAGQYPMLSGVPQFEGVRELRGATMICTAKAAVEEKNRGEAEAVLIREIQKILARHEIPMR